MQAEEIASLAPRIVTVAVLTCAGLSMLSFPGCFAAVCPYFARLVLAAPYEERLDAVLEARKDAENIPMWLGRVLGLVSLVLAVVAISPNVPSIWPYAAWCVAFAGFTAFAYLRFRRATHRRVAALVPRAMGAVLPAAMITAVLASIAVDITQALVSPYHAAWAAVAGSGITLLWIGLVVARAPALILGADLALELYVDARLRAVRALNVTGLAVAPTIVLLGTTHDFSKAGTIGWFVATAAAGVTAVYMVRAGRSIEPQSALAAMTSPL